ncbi:MAG TPA: glycosyltransferase family 4 protein [Candidatus Portnoybacteria bacterium]|nr:glycosyltransferase family 4 protein [Candidatus Portnoybacteria bacterium]
MKILNLSLDNSIIDPRSDLARRVLDYSALVEKYTVIIPSSKDQQIALSEKARIFAVDGCCKFFKLRKTYRLAKKILQQEKYDVISVQDIYFLAWIGVLLSKKFKTGLEVQVHGFEKYRGLRKLIAQYILSQAKVIRCVSQRLKKQLIDDFGVAEEKIMVVPIFTENKTEPKLEKDKNGQVFLTVGRLVPIKNIELQIEAMAEIVKKYPQSEQWIVGDGPEKGFLASKIASLKLEKNIKLLGQKTREELDNIYAGADIFLLTSNSEGWGLAVIEAAKYSLPIIMTDVGCAGEVIKNNESGLIVPIGNKQALIEAMEKLLQDIALRQKLSESAKQAISALPSKQAILNLYLLSWQKAAKESNSL